jgi:Kef-type K+ transport system membrane component KefB
VPDPLTLIPPLAELGTVEGGETIAYVLADLAIILVVVRAFGWLSQRIGQPRVLGEIVGAVLLGPTVLGGNVGRADLAATERQEAVPGDGLVNDIFPVESYEFLVVLAQVALVLFLFLVGLEVHDRFIRGREREALIIGLAAVAIPVGAGFAIAAVLDGVEWQAPGVSYGTHALIIGGALAVTSGPVLSRALQEKRMLATDLGAVGLAASTAIAPLMILVLAAASASAEEDTGAPDSILVKALLAIALVAVLVAVVRPLIKLALRRFDPTRPPRGDLVAALVAGALLSGLAADRIGINALVGGFLFGACLPAVPGLAAAALDRIGGFTVAALVPVFLAVIGLQTDFTVFEWDLMPEVLLILAAMVASKLIGGALAGRAAGLGWRDSGVIGALANSRGIMLLVAVAVPLTFGGITPEMLAALVLGAIVTTAMTKPLVDAMLPGDEVEVERDRSLSGSLAGIPTITGGPRIVLAPGEERGIQAAIGAARQFLGQDPPPQFLVVRLLELRRDGEYVGAGLPDDYIEIERTMGWLQSGADRLTAEGATSEVVSFHSPDPAADLAKLAADWAATAAVAVDAGEADALERAGLEVRRAEVVATAAPSPADSPILR